ncbi:dipeptidyl peptidase 3-like [Actinia tenebrosa]|uniref:Dipeptidyl peptidase 3 n=1 Tax=Actinia tenebrosa TaxID=6105 RepID=A0A6P8IXL7_ACTTE|nr:dipeptidyl peptidase 3-like [Actinia tenebrosa]
MATVSKENLDLSQYTISTNTTINFLDCQNAFEGLTDEEKLYAHYLLKASWEGSLICLFQTSPEAPRIFQLFQKVFSFEEVSEIKERALKAENGLTVEEFECFLMYVASFYGNIGNYKSFGDTKFIPALSKEKFQAIIYASKAYQDDPKAVENPWQDCKDPMYSLGVKLRQLGFGDQALSTYYSSNCDKSDAEFVQGFLKEKGIDAYNTRLFKEVDADQRITYNLRIASVCTTAEPLNGVEDKMSSLIASHEYKRCTIKITRGDYSGLLKRVVENLEKAVTYASNEREKSMLKSYIISFNTGSIEDHKQGSRFWIRDKGPIVETYIGFIETYRDPFGVRAEYEGFVSIVNKAMSEKFGQLVAGAEKLLPCLPWPSSYEKDTFLRPDFTSLDVLGFGSSGIPAGINIPNYDDIRQEEGFKNVSLGNVLSAHSADQKITFLDEQDAEIYAKLKAPSFEVQVGLHELLGHGSGKLFMQKSDGTFNFDIESVKHTETGEKIQSWYTEGENWYTKFADISSSYEECRAECVGIYLCLNQQVLSIFGHEGEMANDIIYINWLNMVRAGLLGLEFYTPENNKWRQAHMQARYVILRVLLEAGQQLVKLEKINGSDGQPDLILTLDRSKIECVGKLAIGDFLRKLQVYKSTADYEGGKALYDHYSKVEEEFLEYRKIVLARKTPRRMFVQANTRCQDNKVSMSTFSSNAEGMIKSFISRFPRDDHVLEGLWRADLPHHKY